MRFLLSGYYGFGNLGDEALAHIIVSQLKVRYPGCAIDMLSPDPSAAMREFEVEATPRTHIPAVRDAVAKADVVISGGGGLLQNATSTRSLLYYAGILRAATRAKRKSMIFAQSVGPLDFLGKTVVREWCKGTTRATVRDERSKKLLSSLLHGTTVEQTADPVFLYDAQETHASLESEGFLQAGHPLVVVCVRKTPGIADGVAIVARAVDSLVEKFGAHVALLPLGGAEDAEVSTMVIRKCKSSPTMVPISDLGGAAAVIAGAHAVIGMRLHALIFAVRYGVPFLAIPYDPKVTALCEDIAYPLPPLWVPGSKRRLDNREIDTLVERLMSDHDAISAHLKTEAVRMRALANRNFEVLDELVRE
ncbi:MAG: polysaccharide pyruvyl transferase CsaB [Candidatus Eremiobacteraeota bacterium]|nr:polysaccharide pyruvyl transferase CsaB [Candidatus Eremiobacteraeota bacterium]